MNYYKRHLGDIAKSLSNLSQGQIGAYDLLLDWIYANECPLPLDHAELYQIGRCRTKAERENVDRVLRYFDRTEQGYTQKRALEEIESYQRRCEINRELGNRGGRPKGPGKKTDRITETQTESVSKKNPSHKPESNIPTDSLPERTRDARTPAQPDARLAGTFEGHPDPPPNPAAPLAVALNRAGFRCTAMNPDLIAYHAAGGTVEHLLAIAEHPDCAGKAATYVIRFARRELAQPAKPITTHPSPGPTAAAPSRTLQGLAALEALKHGNRTGGPGGLAADRDCDGAAKALPALPRQNSGV